MGHDPQLLKGVLGLILLGLLTDGESYGYELALRVRGLGLTEMAHGSVYPALARLEREGNVTSRLVSSREGPARKYYRLTEDGEAALRERRLAWRQLVAAVSSLTEERRVYA